MSSLSYIKQQIITSLVSRTEYRFSIIAFILLSLAFSFTSVFFTYVVFNITDSGVPNWSFYEITFMAGIYTLIRGLYTMFFNIRYMPSEVRHGDLDCDLTKPLNLFVKYVHFDINEVGRFVSSIVMFIVAVPNINLNVTIFNSFYFIVLLFAGIVAMFTVDVFIITFAFFITNINSIQHNLDSVRSKFTNWPMSLYPKSLRLVFTFLFPIIFIGFVPASFFLGKDFEIIYWFSPLIVLILAYLSLKWFYFGLSKYTGTGS